MSGSVDMNLGNLQNGGDNLTINVENGATMTYTGTNLKSDVNLSDTSTLTLSPTTSTTVSSDISGGSVSVASGKSVTVSGEIAVDSLTLEGTSTVEATQGSTIAADTTSVPSGASITVDQGATIDVPTVSGGGTITNNGSGTVGDETVYGLSYLNYQSTLIKQVTWTSSQIAPVLATLAEVKAMNPDVPSVIDETRYEFLGWSETKDSTTVSDKFVVGKNVGNGTYQLFPVVKLKTTSDAEASVDGVPYQTIADAITHIPAGSTITLSKDAKEQSLSIKTSEKDWSLAVPLNITFGGTFTMVGATTSATATFSDVVGGTDGYRLSAGSIAVSGSIKSGTILSTSGITEVKSGQTLNLLKNAVVKIGSGDFVNNGTIYVYGAIEKTGSGEFINNGKIYLMTAKATVADVDKGSDPEDYVDEYTQPSAETSSIITILNERAVKNSASSYSQSSSTSNDDLVVMCV
ncbi:MAG: hypothetical protein IJ592_03475, partial [Candidatus Methanomethylophilaceae archaeon]|nr:hypothetical protein [Candidatus Methanomethylophilaceae archaeon]